MKKFYSVLFALTLGASSLLANPEAVAAQNMGTDIAAAENAAAAAGSSSTAAATGGTIAGVSTATVGTVAAVAAAVGTSDSSATSHSHAR